jgi:hypothetical protein
MIKKIEDASVNNKPLFRDLGQVDIAIPIEVSLSGFDSGFPLGPR